MNFFQPSFKLKEKQREGAKIVEHYHAPATPYERALAHPALDEAVKRKLREARRHLDPGMEPKPLAQPILKAAELAWPFRLLVSHETACIHVPLNRVMAAAELPADPLHPQPTDHSRSIAATSSGSFMTSLRGQFIRIGLSSIR